jgi:Putative Flp pilus-assembly TadE/G-like
MNGLRHERGQVTSLLVLTLVLLLGFAALVIDVGTWFQAQRQTQSVADAAALAAAQALPVDETSARNLAAQYVTRNGGGSATVTVRNTSVPRDTVSVTVSRPAPGFFAKVFGVNSVTVSAKATALTGTPGSVRWGAPFGVDLLHPLLQCDPEPCFNVSTRLDLDKVGPGAYRVLNIDGSHGGVGGQILEEWILTGYGGDMPANEWYYSDPGAKFNSSHVKNALDARKGSELLFPVYRETRGSGANFEYEVVGFVGFVLEDYHIQGSKLSWLEGSFTRLIWEGVIGGTGTAGFGVHSIQLVE